MSALDLASFLPWMIGPLEFRSEGVAFERRAAINFIGGVITDDPEGDVTNVNIQGPWIADETGAVSLNGVPPSLAAAVTDSTLFTTGPYRVDGPGDFDSGAQVSSYKTGSFGVSTSAASGLGGIAFASFIDGSLAAVMSIGEAGFSFEAFGLTTSAAMGISPNGTVELHAPSVDIFGDAAGVRLVATLGYVKLAGNSLQLEFTTHTTVGGAGGGSPLPLTPVRYVDVVTVEGSYCIPLYLRS